MQMGEGIKLAFDAAHLVDQKMIDDPEKLADFLLRKMIVTKVRPVTREAVVNASKDAASGERVGIAVKLILASPEYQLE